MSAEQRALDIWNQGLDRLILRIRKDLDSRQLPGPYETSIIDQLSPGDIMESMKGAGDEPFEGVGRVIKILIYEKGDYKDFYMMPGNVDEMFRLWDMLYKQKPEDEDMSLNQQDKIDMKAMVVEALKDNKAPVESAFVRFQSIWAAIAIIIAIFLAGWRAQSFVAEEVKSQVLPIKSEISEGFDKIDYSLNGNPENGSKGLNERLGVIESKLDNLSTSTDTHSPTPHKATDDSAKPE